MSTCEKHEKAIGSRRANSPSWPCIEAMPKSEAEYTCAVGTGAKAKGACNEGESIYGLFHHDAYDQKLAAEAPPIGIHDPLWEGF